MPAIARRPTARRATAADLDRTVDLALDAFADEAVITWLIPEPTARRAYLEQTFSASVADAVRARLVVVAQAPGGRLTAASFWQPRHQYDDADPPSARDEQAGPNTETSDDDGPTGARLAALLEATGTRQPDVAHLHLSAMAALPDQRGRGSGSAMVAAGLKHAAELGLPVYLEASTPGSLRLYARHGFVSLGASIRLPDGGPTLQPMWRDA
ncbi:GNAT family N-acetyltransferase [Georgenia sp. Z1491]|uniref:GNAT family N-acetyltransferase n=1 Tax=Georgenia sp. Z1491 TaxID=3416707 RepID=UPI003CED2DBB